MMTIHRSNIAAMSICARMRTVLGALIIVLVNGALIDPSAADGDYENWIRDSLSGVHQDQQFLAGERVDVSDARVDDDIFAAGRDLVFDNVSANLIVASGGSLRFVDVSAGDLILAGGEMVLSGNVEDDLVAAVCPVCPIVGRLQLTSRMQIGDEARLAGREVIVDGNVGGNLYAAGQTFELSGSVAGDARVTAQSIVLDNGSCVAGDFYYSGPSAPEVRDGAVVAGNIIEFESPIPFEDDEDEDALWIGVLAVLGVFAAAMLLGVVLQLAMPGVLSRTV